MGRKKSRKTLIKESVKKRQKRSYKKSKWQTWDDLGISDKFGWTHDERQMYFKFISNIHKALKKSNMIIEENRIDDRTKKDFVDHNNHATGIWSMSTKNGLDKTAINFTKHVVKSHSNAMKQYENGEIPYKPKKMEDLCHVRLTHVRSYTEDKLLGRFKDNFVEDEEKQVPLAISTVQKYCNDIKKIFECTSAFGIKAHENLDFKSVKKEIGTVSLYDRVRGKGKTDGRKGYTLEQCEKMIKVMDDDPVGQSMLKTLTYMGFRHEHLSLITWDELYDTQKKQPKETIDFYEGKKLKGGRVLTTDANEEVRESYKELFESGAFKIDDPVYGHMSRYHMEKIVKTAASRAGVDYKGFHEFRYAHRDYRIQQMESYTKDETIGTILKLVNHITKYHADGTEYHPLNPVEDKERFLRDKNNKRILKCYNKDGHAVYKKEKVRDPKTGQVVKEQRYTYASLVSKDEEVLKKMAVALYLSHSRSSVTDIYEHKEREENKAEEITEEVEENVEEALQRTMEFLEKEEEPEEIEELPRDQWEQLSLDLDEE
ncbi:TPA: hypothetical protein ACGW5B_005511 [Bacillus paranthracis]|uniref:hypothetical protein n=1 Tax=Bacillus sp. FSL W8-0519 TaxID=2954624 RepID=UPI00027CCB3F|nr:hypothetical protein BCK_27453 [Bacillus cereus FRI-35]